MRYFHINTAAVPGDRHTIRGADARHIKTVLRLRPGDFIGLFDGSGMGYKAEITGITSAGVEVVSIEAVALKGESPLQVMVAQALLKERKMDRLVRQLSELGITRWMPFTSERTVPRLSGQAAQKRGLRWKKIAREAPKQCRRGRIMEIGGLVAFADVLQMGCGCDLKIIFWEDEAKQTIPGAVSQGSHPKDVLLVLGPEGGFSQNEIMAARAADFTAASLGPRILRAETAAVCASALIQYLYGDMGQKKIDKKGAIKY